MRDIPSLEHDREADRVYVILLNLPLHHRRNLDNMRSIDYSEDDRSIGVSLLDVSYGVNLDNLPQREVLASLLDENGIVHN